MKFNRIIFGRTLIAFLVLSIVPFCFSHSALCGDIISPKISGDQIIFENDFVSYAIGRDGLNKAFIDKKTGKNYLDNNLKTNFMSIDVGRGYIGASKIEYDNNYLFVTFGISKICARIHVRVLPHYFAFKLISVNDKSMSELQLANLPLTNAKFMGRMLANTRDDDFAGCILPLSVETASQVKPNLIKEKLGELPPGLGVDVAKVAGGQKLSSNGLIAWCEKRVRPEGTGIAVIGCPTNNLLDIIEQVEIENGLPHPTIGGVWAKRSKEVRQSYLFLDFSEDTIDEVIDFAVRGGFGYIMIYGGQWNSTDGSYLINEENFPSGEPGLKKAVKKIHDAGLKAGIHNMNGLVSRNDPLVHPIPHPGLNKRWENERTLERDIEVFETFIPTTTSPIGLLGKLGKSNLENRDLQIDNEIITYDDIQTEPPYGFIGCARGAYGTHPANHRKGAKIENLAECYGYFEPDIESDLGDLVSRNLAHVLDYFEFDIIYPENVSGSGRGPYWYMANTIVNKLYSYTKREILWAHEPSSNWAWHVLARGNTRDFVTRGIVEHFDIATIISSRRFAADLQPSEFGWFGLFEKKEDHNATLPKEIEYAYSKACAYNCAMSIETNLSSMRDNGRIEELLSIMRNWEELKFKNYFSEHAIKTIQEIGKEFTLAKDEAGNTVARQISYGPKKYINKIDGQSNSWTFKNAFNAQPIRVKIESMPLLAEYGDPENVVLIRPEKMNIETGSQGPNNLGTLSEGASFTLSTSDEQVKTGDKSFKVTAANNSDNPDGWGCVEFVMDKTKDISKNRAMGTWVYGDGSGVPLHFIVEDASRWEFRDWWVKLDFKGWKYIAIPEPAEGEVYSFKCPVSIHTSIRKMKYKNCERAYVLISNMAPRQQVTCYFSRLEGLREKPGIIKNPKLVVGTQSITFPFTLQTEDYLEYDRSAKFRVFSSEGKTIAENTIQIQAPVLNGGSNQVSFECDYSDPAGQAAKVEIMTLGEPFK